MLSEKEKMLAGELYLASDPVLVQERARAKRLLHRLNVTEYLLTDVAREVLAELVPHAGPNFYIEPPFHCDYGSNIYCGSDVFFNVNCVVLDVMKVTIGSNVLFGPGVQLYGATHPLDAVTRRTVESGRPITIGDDCWFGGGAIVCPGVRIGMGCVIGAGSVVTRDVPAYSLAVGNPARVIKSLGPPA
ncbi:sugar O-acetyltransferase [Hymenobacter coccineus]|uniref:Nodulation protein L n=1 Tax=Hymenobacter coccineus TaxID=1908235 RepID=A0A1G1TFN1_9BACT|nr:sugar O-acetyltransferase [Hymenobacter coccineus]OGX89673.1 maltose acetyltransferase [Hymenobacter coccineus]